MDRCCERMMLQLHRGMMGKESSKRTAVERAPPALYKATDELSREKRSITIPSLAHFFLFFNLGLNFGLGFCIDFFTKVLQRQRSRAGSTSQQLCHAQIHQEAEDGDENPQGSKGRPLQPTHGSQTPSQLQQPLCRHSGVQVVVFHLWGTVHGGDGDCTLSPLLFQSCSEWVKKATDCPQLWSSSLYLNWNVF